MSQIQIAPAAGVPRLAWETQPNEAVETAISHVTARLASSMAPQPLAVVLTGSFARGEGSVLVEGNRARVLGDMEFMVFCDPHSDLRVTKERLKQEAMQSRVQLADMGIECEVEFSAVHPKYLRDLRPQIFGYEFLKHGRVVLGRPDILRTAAQFPVSAIPRWDAWRMLNNRLIEQLQRVEAVTSGTLALLEPMFYQVIKCYLDLGTTLLIFAGRYESTYSGRAAALARWAKEDNRNVFLSTISRAVVECTEFKLSPDIRQRVLGVRLDSKTEELRADVRKMFIDLVCDAHDVWRWEARQLVGHTMDSLSDAGLRAEVLQTQEWRDKLRGWTKLASIPTVRHRRGFTRRVRALYRLGSPRYLIYSVSSQLFFSVPNVIAGREPDVAALEPLLPVVFAEHEGEARAWWRLRANVLSGWKLFLRNEWA